MADLTASSSDPTVTFKLDSPITDWWRIQATSSTTMNVQRMSAVWSTMWSFTSSGHTSQGNLTMAKDDATLSFTPDTGTEKSYTIVNDGTSLKVTSGSAVSGPTDLKIVGNSGQNPRLSFDNNSGTDFSLESDGSNLNIKAGSTTIAHATTASFIGDGGVGAGTLGNTVVKWEYLTGALPVSSTSTTVNLSYTNKVLGVIVMLTKTNQGNATWNVHDYLDAANANDAYKAQVTRSTLGDSVALTYHSSYAPAMNPGRYSIIAFYEL